MAEDNKKFSEEEIKSLKELQDGYVGIQARFGQIAIARVNLKNQADELVRADDTIKDEFLTLQKQERDLIDELTKKYGEGTVNPSTGVFSPDAGSGTSAEDKK
jgi:hypothetical protein